MATAAPTGTMEERRDYDFVRAMTMTTTCPLCGTRKARRECPAVGRSICPVCCGTKRMVELRCPPTCAYLSSARAHPPAVVQKRQERDLRFYLPLIADLTEAQYRLALLLQAVIVRHASSALPAPVDQDVADGAAAAAATLETAGKGIIYEHQATSIPAQRIAQALRAAIAGLSREGVAAGRIERDAAVGLRRIEQGARTAAAALEGDEPPVFLSLIGRLMARGPEHAAVGETAAPAERDRTTGLIVPG